MAKVKVCVLRTAGTNCDGETAFAFEQAGAATESVHVNQVLRKGAGLDDYQILVIPGGFTYGDDIAAGKILANELRYGLGGKLREFIDKGGAILGICNGFQVLVKAGLLPGPFSPGAPQEVTLTFNDSAKFEARWIYLKAAPNKSVFTDGISSLYLPVAHGEGKFVADQQTLRRIVDSRQMVFQYVDPNGRSAGYPWNPNGSVESIAGICDDTGRVLGLMPHPERHVLGCQHPRWTREGLKDEGGGTAVFKSVVNYFRR
ncbi:MAG TPA: phosphoribosylformylglycinamidine synthase I [Planctomycetota bacterium]|nr:phosphoribosylformylglycinamidine synthase I [Planctomycetota bacterium]